MKLCYHCMRQINNTKSHYCPHCGGSLAPAAPNPQYLTPGTVLQGKFIVGNPLGSGGFGNTYIGWNQMLQCRVAIKEYYPRQFVSRHADGVTVSASDTTMGYRFRSGLHQFLEEARSVARLQDIKGVVSIYNFFEANGTGYIVMEYLEGMDVKSILQNKKEPPDYAWCRRVILTVLDTLRDIHRRGVLHRDIAPDNIFVTNEGVIKLIDFGAAKHASELANMKSEIVLKVGYAPIEQYSRTAKQGPYTDIYAVAALFYRMLTGAKPAPANERITEDHLLPPSELGIDIPEQAEMAIMVCLNVQPQYRLQSAGEFMEALNGLNFQPVYEPEWILPPLPKESIPWTARISRMPTMAKALMLFLVLCLLGGGGTGVYLLVRPEKVKTVENQDESVILMEDCVGKPEAQAVEVLKGQGLTNIKGMIYEYDPEMTDGVVRRQVPEAGTSVSPENEITLYISGGGNRFTMQDYSSMTAEEVKQTFTAMNIPVWLQEDYSDDVEKGKMLTQSIPPGTLCVVSEMSETTFTYSLGPRSDYERKMPDLIGKTEQEARKILKKKGIPLKVDIDKDDVYSAIKKGRISDQQPKKGKVINIREDKDDLIFLWTSIGPKPTPTPRPIVPTAKPMPKPSNKYRIWDEEDFNFVKPKKNHHSINQKVF